MHQEPLLAHRVNQGLFSIQLAPPAAAHVEWEHLPAHLGPRFVHFVLLEHFSTPKELQVALHAILDGFPSRQEHQVACHVQWASSPIFQG